MSWSVTHRPELLVKVCWPDLVIFVENGWIGATGFFVCVEPVIYPLNVLSCKIGFGFWRWWFQLWKWRMKLFSESVFGKWRMKQCQKEPKRLDIYASKFWIWFLNLRNWPFSVPLFSTWHVWNVRDTLFQKKKKKTT